MTKDDLHYYLESYLWGLHLCTTWEAMTAFEKGQYTAIQDVIEFVNKERA